VAPTIGLRHPRGGDRRPKTLTKKRSFQPALTLVTVTYRVDGDNISLSSTISIIGDAHDLTLAELRLETFWPADEESRRR
jgi:hypothetical protein